MKNWLKICSPLLLLPSIYAVANPSEQTLDLANGKNTMNFVLDKKAEVKIKIINMLPSKRDSYVISVNTEKITPAAFKNPLLKEDKDPQKTLSIANISGPCSPLEAIVSDILDLTDEKLLPTELAKLHAASIQTRDEKCKAIYDNTLKMTRWEDMLTINRNRKYTVAVTVGDKALANMTISGPSETWLTHVGFAFVDNKSHSFYSKQIPGDTDSDAATYELHAATNRKDYSYTAMAMFTYPFWDIRDNEDWQVGFTAGLGTDADNIAVGLGLSLIIHKNFVITLGAVATEFDVLKGHYEVPYDLGETAIDSADLVEQTYKFAPAITFSYRFGSDE